MATVRILIADDHEVVRRGLRDLISAEPGWEVVAEARNGREAVNKAREFKPEVVVIDLAMPELNGLTATREIRRILPKTEIVLLTMHQSDDMVRQVLEAGARGYVLKSDAGRDLGAAISAAARHKPYFTPAVAELVLDGYLHSKKSEQPARNPNPLTAREREVVQLLAEGKTNKEVASTLGISLKTAEAHRININRKLGLTSVSELVRYAIRNGIISA